MGDRASVYSIVVPTYQRREPLRACLMAIAKLTTPRERFEVIVVDDGSPAPAYDLVREFDGVMDVAMITQQNAGPAAARNTGAARARGHYLAFTDDDCAPAPDWLEALDRHFAVAPTAAIGGQTVNALPADRYSAASQELIDYLYEYYHVRSARGRFFTTSNLALPRAQFEALGGFDVTFPLAAAEDREFCERWSARGFELRYAENVIVRHSHVLTLGGFWRQHFGYGRGAVYLHKARARRGGGRVRLEPLRFYLDLLRFPLRRGVGAETVSASLLMLLSQIAYGAGYYRERLRQNANGERAEARPIADRP